MILSGHDSVSSILLRPLTWHTVQDFRADPAGVVFLDPCVICHRWANLFSITLVVHAVKREWCDQVTQFAMEIGIFIPARGEEKEIALQTVSSRRDAGGRKSQGQFVAAVHERQRIVALAD